VQNTARIVRKAIVVHVSHRCKKRSNKNKKRNKAKNVTIIIIIKKLVNVIKTLPLLSVV